MPATEIVTFELAKGWITNLGKRLLDVRAERKRELDDLGNVFGDPMELASFYVEPECQQFNPADYAEDDTYHVIREPMFDHVAQFLSGKTDRKGKHLFILSDAGTGKTSFLVMLKLSDITSFWPTRMKCRLLKIGQTTLDDISKIEEKTNTILLLDGLDEDAAAWKELDHRVRDLLSATKTFHRTIITCRSQFIELRQDPFMRRGRVELHGELCPVIYMSLFGDKQVRRYLERRHAEKANEPEWMEKAMDIVEKMGPLKMRPMLLAHVDDFIGSTQESWSLFNIFETLIQSWLLREQQKIFEASREIVEPLELLTACRHIAINMLWTEKPKISRREIELEGHFYSGIRKMSVKQFGVRSLLTTDTEGKYRFTHFSILEFLVTQAVIADFHSPGIKAIQSTDLMREFAASWLRSNHLQNEVISRMKFLGLQGASMRNANLYGIDLSGYDCSGVDFSNSNLSGAKFVGAKLSTTSFLNADLTNANFERALIDNATFDFAHLDGASFSGSRLQQPSFGRCKLIKVDFSDAVANSRSVFQGAELGTSFSHPKYLEDQRGADDA
jgi:uncharacterized protein YjbI with pentapeptide repeats